MKHTSGYIHAVAMAVSVVAKVTKVPKVAIVAADSIDLSYL